MQYSQLQEQLLSIAPFSNQELDCILSSFKQKTFRKGEHWLKGGNVAKEIGFITNGLARIYYLFEGKDITTYLACDNGFISSLGSFINQTPSFEFIQFIEDSQIITLSFEQMQELYKKIPNWQKVGRVIAEKNYLCMADRVMKLQMIPAKEKYLNFLDTAQPKVIQKTPLIYIASYLGITPESLSRIRKNLAEAR
jgi:CRP-like cAMP-binding protein